MYSFLYFERGRRDATRTGRRGRLRYEVRPRAARRHPHRQAGRLRYEVRPRAAGRPRYGWRLRYDGGGS